MHGGVELGIIVRHHVTAQWVVAALVTSPERHGVRDARIPCRAIGVARFPNYICLRGGELGPGLFHETGFWKGAKGMPRFGVIPCELFCSRVFVPEFFPGTLLFEVFRGRDLSNNLLNR